MRDISCITMWYNMYVSCKMYLYFRISTLMLLMKKIIQLVSSSGQIYWWINEIFFPIAIGAKDVSGKSSVLVDILKNAFSLVANKGQPFSSKLLGPYISRSDIHTLLETITSPGNPAGPFKRVDLFNLHFSLWCWDMLVAHRKSTESSLFTWEMKRWTTTD